MELRQPTVALAVNCAYDKCILEEAGMDKKQHGLWPFSSKRVGVICYPGMWRYVVISIFKG